MGTRSASGGGRGSYHACQRCQSDEGLAEGAHLVLFEFMVLKLKHRVGITADAMRANHTNLEWPNGSQGRLNSQPAANEQLGRLMRSSGS